MLCCVGVIMVEVARLLPASWGREGGRGWLFPEVRWSVVAGTGLSAGVSAAVVGLCHGGLHLAMEGEGT